MHADSSVLLLFCLVCLFILFSTVGINTTWQKYVQDCQLGLTLLKDLCLLITHIMQVRSVIRKTSSLHANNIRKTIETCSIGVYATYMMRFWVAWLISVAFNLCLNLFINHDIVLAIWKHKLESWWYRMAMGDAGHQSLYIRYMNEFGHFT